MSLTRIAFLLALICLPFGALAKNDVSRTKGVVLRSGSINVHAASALSAAVRPPSGKPRVKRELMRKPGAAAKRHNAFNGAKLGFSALGGGNGNGPRILADFEGTSDIHRFIPPDTAGAVGPNQVVSASNDLFRVTDRSGAQLAQMLIEDFWAPIGVDPNSLAYPHVVYDSFNDRFVASIAGDFGTATSFIGVAVSDTGDPTGTWTEHKIKADPTSMMWADFQMLGINKNWVVVTANMFPVSFGVLGGNLYVIDKAALFGGSASVTLFTDPGAFGQAPAITYDNSVDTLYITENWNGALGQIRLSSITGPVGTETYTAGVALPSIPDTWDPEPPPAPQPGTFALLDTGDSRMLSCFYRNGSIWCTHAVGPSSGTLRCAAQWFQVATDGSVTQYGRVEDPTGVDYFFAPSIATNFENDVLIGYTKSSQNVFASAGVSFRLFNDPPGTTQTPDTIYKAGTAPYSQVRWGDYSVTQPDPSDDGTFWTLQEYAADPDPVFGDTFGTWWAQVNVFPPALTFDINPTVVYAGDPSTGTVTLRDPAPVGGAVVTFGSTDPGLALPPASITIPEGETIGTIQIETFDQGDGLPHQADISASYGGDTISQTLTVLPFVTNVEFLDLIFWVPEIAVTGGNVVQGRVIIAEIAPTGGQVVQLRSSDPDVASVTPSVTVPAGYQVQYFYVFTNPVAFDKSVSIRAYSRGSSAAGIVDVLAPVPTRIQLQPTAVLGGNPAGATVFLTGPAPNPGLDLALASDRPEAQVPAILHIQPGNDKGTFTISTSPVTAKVQANISAAYNGVTVSAPLQITPAGLTLFVINPTSVSAGQTATATVGLAAPAPAGGAVIALSYVNGSALNAPPSSVTIPAGATTFSFPLRALQVTNNTTVTVTASYKGTNKSAQLLVLGNRVSAVTANPQTLHVSTKASCKVYLFSPAGPAGALVMLSATAGELPSQVRILAGQNNAAFTFKAPPTVPPGGKVTITATYPAGISVTTVVSIIP